MTLENDVQSGVFHPGAARFGNFINYYDFNPPSKRIQHIPETFIVDNCTQLENEVILGLDVGCNSGELTTAVFEHITGNTSKQLNILGIDLDDTLIERCNVNNKYSDNITFQAMDFAKQSNIGVLKMYLEKWNRSCFDLITCFSTTMWIHLNHGDEALLKCLKNMANLSNNLIIEPQPWKCYRSASRRMRKLKSDDFYLNALSIRNIDEDVRTYLTDECGMKFVKKFGVTEWGRQIMFFKKS